jgi:hypothetical protein
MSVTVDKIIEIIRNVDAFDAIKILASMGIANYGAKGMRRVKALIASKYNEGMYAFFPSKEEAQILSDLRNCSHYKKLEMLIPKYRHIDIFRTGLLINRYHDSGGKEDRVGAIKHSIGKKPNGIHLMKIVKLPTTPYFDVIMDFMFDLKTKGYTEKQLEDKMDELVNMWEESSRFFTNSDNEGEIESFCRTQIETRKEIFFILGMKSVDRKLMKVIQNLETKSFLERNGYLYKITKKMEGTNPRTEITFLRQDA